ncbi:MAG: rRNA maturation RNase YbeY [Gammaproteobacteria bacterium]|nr:rRNA maturation RNase YbeY [Gammaproteobacteria bacterium]
MSDAVKVAVQVATSDEEVPPGAKWEAWVTATLAGAARDVHLTGCLTLRLVGRNESQHLNDMYRHRLGPTNVLAFAGAKSELPDADDELGDLVICLPVVHDEAEAQGKSALAHLAHLVVHGTLHLAGYDHDNEGAAARMEALETKVMLDLGFPAPYESDDDHRIDDTLNQG